jgi:thiol-disulfide isomerase/thioredoxin
MNIKILLAVVAVAALGVGGFLAVRYTRQVGDTLMSDPQAGGAKPKITFIKDPAAIPELTIKTLDGRTLSNKDLSGKVTLVNFWATWCPPCREEIPDLIKLQERYKDDLLIIGVSSDEGSSEMVAKFAAEHGMNYPIVMETPELTKAFPGIFALPTTFIIDPELKMVKKHVGRLNPGIVELETRVLAKLPVDAQVERVADNTQAILSGNAQATDVPGVDLVSLTPEQKTAALKRLNEDTCTCGCGFTLAQCRINDTSCNVSLPIAEKIVAEIRAGR